LKTIYLDVCCLNRPFDDRSQSRIRESVANRAEKIEEIGIRGLDAVHVACAEMSAAETMLTTDDRMVRAARQREVKLGIKVENPVQWLTGGEGK
jgi:hypothetical protein